MDAYQKYLNEIQNKVKKQFAHYPQMKWSNPWNAIHLQGKRDELLGIPGTTSLFKATKPYYLHISEGCMRCGKGKWSCLFITGRCNAACFYCPASQKHDEVPSSQGLNFPDAKSYAAYIACFGFEAVAFSGGEPLLYPDRVLEYLSEVRKSCDPGIYAWMYTNGRLAGKEIFGKLARAGLDEVRFDIGAVDYSLEPIKAARGIIRNITIEIPAIPGHLEKLKVLLPLMEKYGVKNLNLHQLRLTPHNALHLLKRNYTYVPAEKPVVAESEIMALEVMQFAREKGLGIGINYCSFYFKNRFQQAGFRSLISKNRSEGQGEISEQGYLRHTRGEQIAYDSIRIMERPDVDTGSEMLVPGQKPYGIDRYQVFKYTPEDERLRQELDRLLQKEPASPPGHPGLFGVWKHEYIESGLREY